jgi:membrane-bound ClpP family serine protease
LKATVVGEFRRARVLVAKFLFPTAAGAISAGSAANMAAAAGSMAPA